jgi:Bacterial Ig-like domain (group 1)
MPKLKTGAVGLACLQLTCHQAILTAPAGSTITVIPNPPFISSNGGISIITAVVIEPAGTPVADGTVVQFFTTLGHIDEQGKTNDGVARVNLVADSRSGTANIIAISGGPATSVPNPSPSPSASPSTTPGGGGGGSGSGTATVTIGNINAALVVVTADPPRLTISRSTHITATVLDGAGNPVAGAPVWFDLPDHPGTEFLDFYGPVFTNNNGQAETVMRTRRETAGNVTVRAFAPGASGAVVEGTTVVSIAF